MAKDIYGPQYERCLLRNNPGTGITLPAQPAPKPNEKNRTGKGRKKAEVLKQCGF